MNRRLVLALITIACVLFFQASLPIPFVAAQAQPDLADTWTWPLSPWEDFVVGDAKNGGIGYGDRFVQPSGVTLHGGIDAWHKAGDAKTAGQPVYAVANGTVSYLCSSDKDVLDCQGFGKAVLISHNLPPSQAYDGTTRLTSVYGHLDASKPIIKPLTDGKPTKVTKGQIIGYLAPTGRCGSICTSAHIHFGIRKGHYGEVGFPSGGWGYVLSSDTKEFSQWINPIDFIRERSNAILQPTQAWRTEPQSLTFFLPWWRTFYTCDSRRIKVYLDGNQIFYTSFEDGSSPSKKASVFVGFGNHTLKVEVFDYPETPAVSLGWPLVPVGPTCAAETIPTPIVSTPTRAPVVALPTVPSTRAPTAAPPTASLPTRVPTSAPPTAVTNPTARTARDGTQMVFVPAGDFTMGGGNHADDQKPIHIVFLDAFWIDKYEVTNTQYKKCVDDGKCPAPRENSYRARYPYYGNPQYGGYPVVNISWNNANAYCTWAGKRLPTEAEWEKAARGTDGRRFPWGNSFNKSLSNAFEGSKKDTTPVGSYLGDTSPYGAMDMMGNVSEWIADWYGFGYYAVSPRNNPKGPPSGDFRVVRGRSWDSWPIGDIDGVYSRGNSSPEDYWDFLGMRCAQ